MPLKRKDIYITNEQVIFLSELPGTISEHIRRAIDEYIDRLKGSEASASQSKGVAKNR